MSFHVTTILAVLALVAADDGRQSLRDYAKQHGGKAENDIIQHFDVMSVDDLAAKADMIVFCRIDQVTPIWLRMNDTSLPTTAFHRFVLSSKIVRSRIT